MEERQGRVAGCVGEQWIDVEGRDAVVKSYQHKCREHFGT